MRRALLVSLVLLLGLAVLAPNYHRKPPVRKPNYIGTATVLKDGARFYNNPEYYAPLHRPMYLGDRAKQGDVYHVISIHEIEGHKYYKIREGEGYLRDDDVKYEPLTETAPGATDEGAKHPPVEQQENPDFLYFPRIGDDPFSPWPVEVHGKYASEDDFKQKRADYTRAICHLVFDMGREQRFAECPDDRAIALMGYQLGETYLWYNLRATYGGAKAKGVQPCPQCMWPCTESARSHPRWSNPSDGPRAVLAGPAMVLDRKTGLLWGRETAEPGDMTYAEAEEYCRSRILAGLDGWRIPTAEELNSVAALLRSKDIRALSFSLPDGALWTSDVQARDKRCYLLPVHPMGVPEPEWADLVRKATLCSLEEIKKRSGKPHPAPPSGGGSDAGKGGQSRRPPGEQQRGLEPSKVNPEFAGLIVAVIGKYATRQDFDYRRQDFSGATCHLVKNECSLATGISDMPQPGKLTWRKQMSYGEAKAKRVTECPKCMWFVLESARTNPKWADPSHGRRFVCAGPKVLLDRSTGLLWCTKNDFGAVPYDGAVECCKSLQLGPLEGWRLPTSQQIAGVSAFVEAGSEADDPSLLSVRQAWASDTPDKTQDHTVCPVRPIAVSPDRWSNAVKVISLSEE